MLALVKTPKGLEEVVRSKILLREPTAEVRAKPLGYLGLVVIDGSQDIESLTSWIKEWVPEAEKVIRFEKTVRTDVDEILSAVKEVALRNIGPNDSFAVRTVRRGADVPTSIELSARAGAIIQELTNAPVDLDFPDKIVQIEVVGDRTGIGIVDGKGEWSKKSPEKGDAARFFGKFSVVQMPYLGSAEGAFEVGRRVGRFVQTFEVRELVVAPIGQVDAWELAEFLRGVRDGIRSRYKVQRASYGRSVKEVPVYVQDLYQLVLSRRDEPMIVFEPEGREVSTLIDRITEALRTEKRVNLLFGSREGVPKGIFRMANYVVDLCPYVTLPTELAAPSALIALYTAYRSATTSLEET